MNDKEKEFNEPLLKWTGSKRKMAKTIVSFFPKDINCYYEPFLGGGSVFLELLKTNHNVDRYVLSDKNEALIEIYKLVKYKPKMLIDSYQDKWEKFQKDSDFYYSEREYYNINKDPHSLFFLTRTCYNGTIRYNSKGEFNVSHHFGRPGIHPTKIDRIIDYYSSLMYRKDISFYVNSYEKINPTGNNNVVYLDPPYTNTKNLYFGNIVLDDFLNWVKRLKCSWFMNLNCVNEKDNEIDMNINYSGKECLRSGKSSFSRLKGKDVMVGEYFYYHKP